jgi:energy-converting hydrogenase Eha subunit H
MHETLTIVHSAALLFFCVSSVGICPISCLLIQFFRSVFSVSLLLCHLSQFLLGLNQSLEGL